MGGVGVGVDFGWGGRCWVDGWFRFGSKVQDCFIFFVERMSCDFVVEGFVLRKVCYLGCELGGKIFFVDVEVIFVDVIVDEECVLGVDGIVVEVLHSVFHRGIPDFEIAAVEDFGLRWVGIVTGLREIVDVDDVGVALGGCVSVSEREYLWDGNETWSFVGVVDINVDSVWSWW